MVRERRVIGLEFDEDLFDDEAKENTPKRIERMMEELKEWREWKDLEEGRGIFYFKGYNDLVIVRDIPFTTWCSHHVREFSGIVHVAYLPNEYVVGLSKIARTVRKFSAKPQIQEILTHEIADYLYKWIPQVQGVMVIVIAEHNCMKCRGVMSNGRMVTSAIRGKIPKEEVLELLKISGGIR